MDGDGSTETTDEGAHMRQADTLPGAILRSRPAEDLEDALMVLGIDAAPVVLDLVDDAGRRGAGRDPDPARRAVTQVLERVLDQVGEDLLDGKTVANARRQGI